MKYNLKQTLYSDFNGSLCTDKRDGMTLFAKKGTLFECFELTEEIRNEYGEYDKKFNYIFIDKNRNYILSENDNMTYFVNEKENKQWSHPN